jgi:quinoprotein glucose dehydrogenase
LGTGPDTASIHDPTGSSKSCSKENLMSKMAMRVIGLIVLLAAPAWMAMPTSAQSGATGGEWRYYGADPGSTRYSPLDQINKTNVKDLRIAWRWKTDNFGPQPDYNYQATPIMVGGVLYTTAGSLRDAVAINAATGETLWMYRYEEGERAQKAPVRSVSGRGVSYWTDGTQERIFLVTLGYHLIALDAKTGRPVPGFGKDGVVDLFEGLDRPIPEAGQIGWGSPAMVVGDVVVIGANMLATAPTKEYIAGFVRGFDVRSGKRIWIFHTIPRSGEFGNETWESDAWSYTGNTGVWAPMAADLELGYIYLPVETPTNDGYGGHRPGAGLFGESLVCVEAKTGKRIWHFQFVHHGIWDWDLPTAPMLLDLNVNGRRIKAVAQVTKQAWTYVFDRVTGEPVWPIVERPVPQTDVPGEKTWPTQPFPTKPPAFDRQGVTLDDLIDFTPELKAEGIKIASQYKLGPIFTPPVVTGANGLKGTLMLPAPTGGSNWQGGAVDPETGMLYVSSVTNLSVWGLIKDPKRSSMDYIAGGGAPPAGGAQIGCPGVGLGVQGLPIVKPPYGRLSAFDLNTGEQAWMVPNGDTPDCIKNHPALKGLNIPKTGKPERGGIMVTKTLLFAGEGSGLFAVAPYSGGPMFRAYDKKTGEIISEFKLPANQSGMPMTYMLNGHQYIAVAVGAVNSPAELVALWVP